MSIESEAALTVLAARNYLYLILTRAFGQDPDEALFRLLVSEEAAAAARLFLDKEGAGRFEAAAGKWVALLNNGMLVESARSECMRLLILPNSSSTYPWESSHGKDVPLIFQKAVLEVRQAFKNSGLKLVTDLNVPDDHLAYELLYLQTMGERSYCALEDGDMASYARFIEHQVRFLDDHVLAWIPEFCLSLEAREEPVYLPVLAGMLRRFLAADRAVLPECLKAASVD